MNKEIMGYALQIKNISFLKRNEINYPPEKQIMQQKSYIFKIKILRKNITISSKHELMIKFYG
jgi:hypothetical protein